MDEEQTGVIRVRALPYCTSELDRLGLNKNNVMSTPVGAFPVLCIAMDPPMEVGGVSVPVYPSIGSKEKVTFEMYSQQVEHLVKFVLWRMVDHADITWKQSKSGQFKNSQNPPRYPAAGTANYTHSGVNTGAGSSSAERKCGYIILFFFLLVL